MKPSKHHLSYHYGLKFFIAILLVLSCFTNFSVAEAAKPDRTAPSAPTNLHTTAITDSSVSLAWSSSTDNVGVKSYDVYKNNTVIGSTASTQYTVNNLSSSTSYTFL